MKVQAVALASLVWLISLSVQACNYADDPRLSNEQLPALLQTLTAGESVPPIQIRIGKYLELGERSRKLLEPHLQIVDVNCSPIGGLDGELLGRAVITFEEFYRTMAQSIKDDRPATAKQLFLQVRVAPMSLAEIQRLFSKLPYANSHGVKVRERMQEIFPQFARAAPFDKNLADPLDDGRPEDYAMFKLFQIFGGKPLLDQGCGPYVLDEAFYKTEKNLGLHNELIVRRKPFLHMMQALGYQVSRVDDLSYRIVNLNCE